MNTSSSEGGDFRARVAAHAASLTPRERAVTDLLLNRPAEAVTASAAQLASMTGTSDATVVRTARSLGYPGLRELKRSVLEMLTARRDPALVLDRRLERLGGERVLDGVLADSVDVLGRVPDVLDAHAWAMAVDLLDGAQRVVACGIGPAATAARYLAVEVGRLGRRVLTIETTGFRLADDLLALDAGDVLVVHAPLRLFGEIEVMLACADDVGAPAVVVTEALTQALGGRAAAVLTTPPSTTGAASENLTGWVLAHGLAMELASRDRSGAVSARQRLNRLRADIVGHEPDTPVIGEEPHE